MGKGKGTKMLYGEDIVDAVRLSFIEK